MKKKILYVITKSEPFGGAQRYVFELATSLPREQFDITVALGGSGTLKKRLDDANVRTITIPNLKRDFSFLGELFAFFFLLRLLKHERPDILHLNSSKAGGLGALAGRIRGVKKIIFTGHGWAFNEPRSSLQKMLLGILHWITIVLTHATIAVSKKTRTSVGSFPVVQAKIHTIYNGVSAITFKERTAARIYLSSFSTSFALYLETYPQAYLIGINSELHNNKGIDIALKALEPILKNRKNLALVIAGGGEERVKLEKMAQNLGISKSVFFLGTVPDARLYLKAYDLFLMPSRTEALPYAVIEAGFADLPVIATNVGGIPEIISHTVTGLLVPPDDIPALERALMICMENPELCTEFGSKLGKMCQETFPLERMVRETVSLYEKL